MINPDHATWVGKWTPVILSGQWLARSSSAMDFQGQKLAERLMLYIICIAGLVAFCMGWLEGSFALMMKVRHSSLGSELLPSIFHVHM